MAGRGLRPGRAELASRVTVAALRLGEEPAAHGMGSRLAPCAVEQRRPFHGAAVPRVPATGMEAGPGGPGGPGRGLAGGAVEANAAPADKRIRAGAPAQPGVRGR